MISLVRLSIVTFALLGVLLPAPGAVAETTTHQHFSGVLVGGGVGLHITKHATWRAVHPVPVLPGTVSIDFDLQGIDTLGGGDFWLTVVGTDNEAVVGSEGGTHPERHVTLSWPLIERHGFGQYHAVVTCGLCIALEFDLDVTTRFDDQGANVTVGERRILSSPGQPSRVPFTITNTGTSTGSFVLLADAVEKKWSFAGPLIPPLGPGSVFSGEFTLTPKHNLEDGERTDFDVVVRSVEGTEHDRVAVSAAISPELESLARRSHVVIALIDTGVNPYHEEFRGSFASDEHPAWFVDAYPEEALALPLTLDASDYESAKASDEEVWAQAGQDNLYYVPGTRIIGAVCFGGCKPLDEGGHGTGTASLAAGTTLGEAPDALIVAVNGDFFKGARWAARQPWIDVISMSLGPYVGTCTVGVCDPASAGTGNPYVPFSMPYAQKLAYESGKRFFTGSSQGVGAAVNTTTATGTWSGASGGCAYIWSSSFAGSPWTFAIETYWPWTELPWRTSCFPPDMVAEGWDLVAASARSVHGTNGFGHASGATPQAAGAYARVVVEARRVLGSSQEGALESASLLGGVTAHLGEHVLARGTAASTGGFADGVLTVAEAENMFVTSLEQVDVVTSFERHGDDPRWERDAMPVPAGEEYAQEGWGLLTDRARAQLLSVAQATAEPPPRLEDRAQYEAQFAFRLAFWEPHVENEIWVF